VVEPFARDASVETFDIDDDVGQFRHATAVRLREPECAHGRGDAEHQ